MRLFAQYNELTKIQEQKDEETRNRAYNET